MPQKCDENCTCNRHSVRQKCESGCVCGRHKPRTTPERQAASYEKTKARNREYMRNLRATSDEWREKQRECNRTHGRRYQLTSKYGITIEQWNAMLIAQSGCCYLCEDPLMEERIDVDHDHSCCSGKKSCGKCIRGLACQHCNQGIGQFKDDVERIRRIADNLEKADDKLRSSP